MVAIDEGDFGNLEQLFKSPKLCLEFRWFRIIVPAFVLVQTQSPTVAYSTCVLPVK